MIPDSEIHRALRRGRLRAEILTTLTARGEMHVDQLAEACRTEGRYIAWALRGRPPGFKRRFGLAHLGLVRWIWRPSGWSVEATRRGADFGARLATGWRP